MLVVLQPAALSHHEHKFFNLYENDLPTPAEIVKTFQDFQNNFRDRFGFDQISPFIDFNQFILAGGSVLMFLLRNSIEAFYSDLDFLCWTRFQQFPR
ncbi:unnamed protein product [Rotaria sp. Silwood1]|nr:unnamed protein product [Rotaria sp. Silwood1]CAF3741303.1 unnamed protein product [Rotaria sp. Silwood1]CAF4557921.1 unnamed protein product [Rotaria sp. Silwood1]CAF4669845.1 unnamed protein product [Rotaria sp. Silwood1]CAF4847451.1 unnamed protein product [Rotaria sp. Silwood1]